MKYRVLITVGAWIAVLFCFVFDGQVFTHALQMLGAFVVGAVPWLPLLTRRRDPRGRAVGFAIVGVSLMAVVAIAINLPRDYEAQKRFNERRSLGEPAATPNHALQTDDHLPRFARSLVIRRVSPAVR